MNFLKTKSFINAPFHCLKFSDQTVYLSSRDEHILWNVWCQRIQEITGRQEVGVNVPFLLGPGGVVLSPPSSEEAGARSREIESRRGIGW
jgi:hypothetical protein